MTGPIGLSARQVSILERLATGMTATETAADLDVAVSTIREHQKRIYKRLGVHSAGDAVLTYRKTLRRLHKLTETVTQAKEIVACHTPDGNTAHQAYINRQLRAALGVAA